jgi:3-deoxy-D-manno-octulosonate 8-phosphate phosphatase (KDO 8-P phosphatase)
MVKLFAMDVDGTLTDGKIYMGCGGEAVKAFDAKDGYALRELLPGHGIVPAIITGRSSRIVEARAAELGIAEVHQRVADKAAKLLELVAKYGCAREDVAYIGDDDNDLGAMAEAGVSGCPADASRRAKAAADYVASRNGGAGAVREFAEWLVAPKARQ